MKKVLVIPLFMLLVIVLVSSLALVACSSPSPTPATSAAPPAPAKTSAPAPAPATSSAAPAPAPATTSAAPAPAPATSAPPAAAAPITLKFGYDTPPTTGLGVPAEYFAKEVTARTNGRVKVQTYPAGALVGQGSSLQALRTGVADIYVLSFGANLDSFPIINFTSLPGLSFFPDTQKDIKAEVDTMRAIIAKYPSAKDEIKGLKLIWSDTYSTAVLMGKKQIKVPADMAGVKVGVDGMRQQTAQSVSAVPVFTIPPQMYQQLQNGVVDSVMVAWGAALDWQLFEQTKWVLDWSFGGAQMPVFMSEAAFNKISAADQKILMDVAAEAEQKNREFVDAQIPQARAKWAAAGVTIYAPNDSEKKLWMDKYQTVWDTYLSKNKAAGAKDMDSIFNDWKNAALTPRK
jgi:TRAP-type transport system periplasmic protein